MSNSSPIEQEIQRLLKSFSVEGTAQELIQKYNWTRLSLEELETLFTFYSLEHGIILT